MPQCRVMDSLLTRIGNSLSVLLLAQSQMLQPEQRSCRQASQGALLRGTVSAWSQDAMPSQGKAAVVVKLNGPTPLKIQWITKDPVALGDVWSLSLSLQLLSHSLQSLSRSISLALSLSLPSIASSLVLALAPFISVLSYLSLSILPPPLSLSLFSRRRLWKRMDHLLEGLWDFAKLLAVVFFWEAMDQRSRRATCQYLVTGKLMIQNIYGIHRVPADQSPSPISWFILPTNTLGEDFPSGFGMLHNSPGNAKRSLLGKRHLVLPVMPAASVTQTQIIGKKM